MDYMDRLHDCPECGKERWAGSIHKCEPKSEKLTFEMLRNANVVRCKTGFGHTLDSWSVAEWGCATAGECGEACNIAKKILRFRDNVAGNKKSKEEYIKDLASEIAGTLIYLDLWAASQGINLEDAVRTEYNKKSIEIGSDRRL